MPPPKVEPLEVTVARIEEHVKSTNDLVAAMNKRLFDNNGQMGAVPRLEQRADALESAKDRAYGALYIIGSGLAIVGGGLAAHLLGKF